MSIFGVCVCVLHVCSDGMCAGADSQIFIRSAENYNKQYVFTGVWDRV